MFDRATAATPALARPMAQIKPWHASLVVVLLAAIIHVIAPLDTDLYWLISVCRRLLNGARLYQDIVESNPPMAVFIYLPATWIERVTGLPAESVFVAMILASGALSAWVFTRLARLDRWALPIVLFIMLVAPLSAFGEREHAATILTLPLLGLAIRRAKGEPIAWQMAILIGVLAGMAAMIKPYFAAGPAAAYIWLAVHQRRVSRLAAPENLAAATAALLYMTAVSLWIPAYVNDVVPLVLDVYRPMREPLQTLASAPVLTCVIAAVCLSIAPGLRRLEPAVAIPLVVALASLVSYIDQGRGWAYHAWPALSALMMATAFAIPAVFPTGTRTQTYVVLIAAIAAFANMAGFLVFSYPGKGVVPAIRAAVQRPSVVNIAFNQSPSVPITALAHGSWAGTYSSRWITVNANYLLHREHDPAKQARLRAWISYDRTVTNRDLMKRPDIVLIGLGPFDWPGWINADSQTRALMSNYAPLAEDRLTPQQRARFEGVAAYIRKDLLTPAH